VDLGVTNTNDCRIQHNGWRRGPKVGYRRRSVPKVSKVSALVDTHPDDDGDES
jgi:hypothetical protein